MKFVANFFSFVFHPLLITSYALLILISVNPYLFSIQDSKQKWLIVFSVVFLSFVFPLIAIGMMRGLGLIKSLRMECAQERVGPLIATGIFYLWLYINIRNLNIIPQAYTMFVLGTTISLFLAFFINNFSKISLHAVGMGGIVIIVFLIRFFFSYEYFYLSLGFWGNFQINFNLVLLLVILLAGMVASSRLVLGAHTHKDVYGGFFIGCVGQLLSFRFLFEL